MPWILARAGPCAQWGAAVARRWPKRWLVVSDRGSDGGRRAQRESHGQLGRQRLAFSPGGGEGAGVQGRPGGGEQALIVCLHERSRRELEGGAEGGGSA